MRGMLAERSATKTAETPVQTSTIPDQEYFQDDVGNTN